MYINTMVLNFDSKEELEFFREHLCLGIRDESKFSALSEEDDDLWIEYDVNKEYGSGLGKEIDRLQALFKFEQDKDAALEVAKEGESGVIFEINKLEEEFGFDCSSYYQPLSFIDEEKLDAPLSENKIPERSDDTFIGCTNLCLRDRLYRKLGIYDKMQEAYKKLDNSSNLELGE